MFGLGVTEIVVIMVIALIFLGPKKLPGLAKGLGKGMRNFQDALRGIETEINRPDEVADKPLPEVPSDDDLYTDSGYQEHSDEEIDKLERYVDHEHDEHDFDAEHAALEKEYKEKVEGKKEKKHET